MIRMDEIRTIKEFAESPIFFLWSVTREDKEIHHCYGCDLIQDELHMRINEDTALCRYTTFEEFVNDIRKICDECWCHKYGEKTCEVLKGDECNE